MSDDYTKGYAAGRMHKPTLARISELEAEVVRLRAQALTQADRELLQNAADEIQSLAELELGLREIAEQ